MTVFLKPKDQKPRPKKRRTRSEAELPPDGIEKWWDELHHHMKHKVIDPRMWEEIRAFVFGRCGGRCEGCGCWLGESTFHIHHWRGKGAGKACDCYSCIQALCPDAWLEDGTKRLGCHSLVHGKGDLSRPFKR